MTDAEFRDWLDDEVINQRMTSAQRVDILEQKSFFDGNRAQIVLRHRNRVAGYVAGDLYVADTLDDLFDQAANIAPGRMVYFEPVGFVLF